jgi:hypothetical protein
MEQNASGLLFKIRWFIDAVPELKIFKNTKIYILGYKVVLMKFCNDQSLFAEFIFY